MGRKKKATPGVVDLKEWIDLDKARTEAEERLALVSNAPIETLREIGPQLQQHLPAMCTPLRDAHGEAVKRLFAAVNPVFDIYDTIDRVLRERLGAE